MCGIAGLVGLPPAVARPRVDEALRRLVHRGPDGVGVHSDQDAVLGMRRLAIIDIENGDQPIYNEDRTVAVVCNGELYNYVEQFEALRARGHVLQSRSDVNLLPHLYEERGADAVVPVRGMFAAAIWDARRRRLVLARDRAGKKPLFYHQAPDGSLAFASELPALLAMLPRTPRLRQRAIADYLALGAVPHPQTIYEGVQAVPPGCVLVWEPGQVAVVRAYWTPQPAPDVPADPRLRRERVEDTLREAVALRLRSDVPVGLFLSGGIDSGLVASYAAELGARDLLAFVVTVDDQALDEAPAARATAEALGLQLEVIPLRLSPREAFERVPRCFGQPFGDSSALPTYFVAEAAAAHRKVVLNGDGGDEVFAGYRRYWPTRLAPWLIPLTSPVRPVLRGLGRLLAGGPRRSSLGFAARVLRGLGHDRHARYLAWSTDLLSTQDMRRVFPDLAAEGPTLARLEEERHERLDADSLDRALRTDWRLILADDLLSKMDIATMAHSLEARSPLLDIPLAELAWALPARERIRFRETKPLLRALARARLPRVVAEAPKRGFEVPVATWLRHDLREAVHDLLLADDSRVGALGDRSALRALVVGAHRFAGNWAQTVWCLLVLEQFLRDPAPAPARV